MTGLWHIRTTALWVLLTIAQFRLPLKESAPNTYTGCRLSHAPSRPPVVHQRGLRVRLWECSIRHPVLLPARPQAARECLCRRLHTTSENVSHMIVHRHRHHSSVTVLIPCPTAIIRVIHIPMHHHHPIRTRSAPTLNIGQTSRANSLLMHPQNGRETGRKIAKSARENTPSIPTRCATDRGNANEREKEIRCLVQASLPVSPPLQASENAR